MNIVQLISSQFGGENLKKLSSLLGESPERTQSAVGAVVPTVLGGLTHVASTPEGAQRLDGVVSRLSPDITPNFGATTEGSSTILSNLFGGGMFNNLAAVLGRFTGMQSTTMGSLIGMVAPVAFGGLAKVKQEQGLDASGLAGFLDGQTQNIAAAMPSGLSTMLGGIPGLSGLSRFAQKAPGQKMEEPAYASAGAAPAYAGTGAGGGGRPGTYQEHRSAARWLVPLLVLAVIIWALWGWGHRHAGTTMQNPAAPVAANVGQLSSSLQNTLSSATSTLSGVSDAASAQRATPQLAQLNDRLASLKTQFNQLSPSARSSLSSTMQPMVGKLQQLSAKARGIPGVNDQFKSTLDQFDSNLAGLGSATTTNP